MPEGNEKRREWYVECGTWWVSEVPGVYHPTVIVEDHRPEAERWSRRITLTAAEAQELGERLIAAAVRSEEWAAESTARAEKEK